jgi:hypothetical protein
MKLNDAREAYYDYSRTLSNINRQLALFGIAIVWFFVQPAVKVQNLDFGNFKWSFVLFCGALFFDLCHYASATTIWGVYSWQKEKKITESKIFRAPECINWVSIIMMILKVISTILGYFSLITNTGIRGIL